jgi:hypothetical protein
VVYTVQAGGLVTPVDATQICVLFSGSVELKNAPELSVEERTTCLSK